jgi:branched-chain amino acid aminotransferase
MLLTRNTATRGQRGTASPYDAEVPLDLDLRPAPEPLADAERAAILADPGFGRYFTDHMVTAVWNTDDGWHDAGVHPLEPFTLHPAAAVLHYGQEIFEGLKAYRHADGSVWLFRPDRNAARFAHSAQRLALPVLGEDDFVAAVAALVRADVAWVPDAPDGQETSLYLRPFMIATEAFLGVRPAHEATFGVVASPAGPYFSGGVQGVNLWVTDRYVRASRGGTGDAKTGGNYAASLAAQAEARDRGCDQVLYLDGEEHAWLEEAGTMNVFLVTADGELLTPALGSILEGVTRDSLLDLAPDLGLTPVERRIGLAELRERLADGSVVEVFAAGTAAVVTPVVGVRGEDAQGVVYEQQVGDGTPGATSLALRSALLDLQYGRTPDARGWLRRVV